MTIEKETEELHLFTNEEILAQLAWQESQGGPEAMRDDDMMLFEDVE